MKTLAELIMEIAQDPSIELTFRGNHHCWPGGRKTIHLTLTRWNPERREVSRGIDSDLLNLSVDANGILASELNVAKKAFEAKDPK